MTPASSRRAVLLALALTATACDLAQFAMDPKPRFEETWNLPGPDTRMSVADLLPSNVTILWGAAATAEGLADSAAFSMSMDSTTFSAQLGPNCGACVPLNGTSANKPAFTMAPGNSTALPADIVSAAILSGRIQVKLVNNLTFDPLYVNTLGSTTQGTLVILIRSNSVVLGKDSIRGAATASAGAGVFNTPFAPGSTLTRTINLNTGTVLGNLTVDVSVNSPVGDHPVPIDVSKFFNATASVPAINVASVNMNVPSRTFDSGGEDSISMAAKGDQVVGLGLDMTITNPFPGLTGGLNLVFAWGPGPTEQLSKPVTLPTGTALRTVTLNTTETQALLAGGDKVSIKLTGNVAAGSAITVMPKQEVKIANRLRITIRTSEK